MTVRQAYKAEIAARGYTADPAQWRAVEVLGRCAREWTAFREQRSNSFKKLIHHPAIPRGVYLYGGVGRGKSFLMDCFFSAVPLKRKTRLHFHEFMREVHRELAELRGTANPLDMLARRMAKKYRLICFDEFHLADITDAMILHRLLAALFITTILMLVERFVLRQVFNRLRRRDWPTRQGLCDWRRLWSGVQRFDRYRRGWAVRRWRRSERRFTTCWRHPGRRDRPRSRGCLNPPRWYVSGRRIRRLWWPVRTGSRRRIAGRAGSRLSITGWGEPRRSIAGRCVHRWSESGRSVGGRSKLTGLSESGWSVAGHRSRGKCPDG